ncbi:MAG: hypothetical protein GY941_22455 [Planctomycetes bacterium]|nr:hypothetical protein [Planctomycetota bacterium]
MNIIQQAGRAINNIVNIGDIVGGVSVINGKTYKGNTVQITKNKIIIDGVVQDELQDGPITIEISGNVGSVETVAGSITVQGDTDTVTTTNGDITCEAVQGSIKTVNGDVKCGSVHGGVSTVNGDIKHV